MLKEEIEALRRKVEVERQQEHQAVDAKYTKQLDALAVVLHLAATYDALSQTATAPEAVKTPLTDTQHATMIAVDGAAPTHQPTLIDKIVGLFRTEPGQSWNVRTLHKALADSGFTLASRDPKGGIKTSLAKLTERKLITIISHGKGRQPTEYRLVIHQQADNNGARGIGPSKEFRLGANPLA